MRWRGLKEAGEEDEVGQDLDQPGQDPAGGRQEEGVIEDVDSSREGEGRGGKENRILMTQLQSCSNQEGGRKSETLSQRKKNFAKILWRH